MVVPCNFNQFGKYGIQLFSVFVATLAMLADGMQFGWASPAVPKLQEPDSLIEMTTEQSKWITETYILGNVAGVLVSISLFSKLSRKYSLFVSIIPIVIAWMGNLFANSITLLYITRFVGGIGRNMVYVTVPMYIGEIADPKIRGMLGTSMYIMMNTGLLISYCIVPQIPLYISSSVGLILALIPLMLLKFIPESPYYLVMKGKNDEAREALQQLKGTKDVEEDLKNLTTVYLTQSTEKTSFYKLFTVQSNRKALGILLMLRGMQMFSGISAMTLHIHMIFKQAGGNLSPNVSAIIYAVIMLCSCLVSMGVMDRFGRKSLMVTSCAVASMMLTAQGLYFYLKAYAAYDFNSITWLPIVTTVIYVLGYRIGLGTVPIVMVGELFPTNVKVPGVVLTDLMYSISSFVSNTIFHFTEDTLGIYTPFWIFACFSIIGGLFSLIFVPETRGRTLEEIQMILINKPSLDEPKKEEVC